MSHRCRLFRPLASCMAIVMALSFIGCEKRATPNGPPDDALAPEALLDGLRDRYLALETYQDEVRWTLIVQYQDQPVHEESVKRLSLTWKAPNRMSFTDLDDNDDLQVGLFCEGVSVMEVHGSAKRYTVSHIGESLEALLATLDQLSDELSDAAINAAYHPMLALLKPLRSNPHNIFHEQFGGIEAIERDFRDEDEHRRIVGRMVKSSDAEDLENGIDDPEAGATEIPFTLVLDREHGLVLRLEINMTEVMNAYIQFHDDDTILTQYKVVMTVTRQVVNEPVEDARFEFQPPADYERIER